VKKIWIIIMAWILVMTFLIGMLIAFEARASEVDTKFVVVSSYLVLMTVFDVETTFSAIHNGAHEANPLIKPFTKNGRLATYGVQFGIDALILWLAYEMKGSKNQDFRKIWWIAPSIVGTAHGVAGGLNLRYCW
jgi:lysylphosphatidylglycerol synthetase-like protein (DUF2156 family)